MSEHATNHGRGFSETTYCPACVEYGARQALANASPAIQAATHLQLALEALASLAPASVARAYLGEQP